MTKPTRGAINELFALLKPFRLIVSVSIVLGMGAQRTAPA